MINWSKRLSEDKAWMIQALGFTKNQPETFRLVDKNHFTENVKIISEQFQGDINSKWIIRKDSRKTITYAIGQILGSETLKSPQGYREFCFESYVEGSITQKISNTISIEGQLGLHLYFNKSMLNRSDNYQSGRLLFAEPRLKLIKQRADDLYFSLSYSKIHWKPNLINRVADTIFQGNNSWIVGNTENKIGSSNIFAFSFNKGNLLTGNAWQTLFYFVWFRDFLSTNSWINPSKIIYEKIWTKHPIDGALQYQYDYFIDKLSSNIRFNSRFQFSKTKHQFNGLEQPWNKHFGIKYGAEWRSAFSGKYNFHVGASRLHTIYVENNKRGVMQNFRNQIDNEYFMDIYFQPWEQLNVTIKQLAIQFKNEDDGRLWFYDLGMNLQFNPKSKKLRWELSGYNLLNENKLNRFARTEWGHYTSSYIIRSRQLIVKLNLQI